VSSFGLLSLCGNGEPAALVEVGRGEAEILVTDKGRMEFSRTAPLEDGFSPDQVAQEIRRTLLSYGTKGASRTVDRILLAGEGPEAAALATAVGQALDRSILPVGPGTLETATAAGVCAGLLRGTAMPDLLHPPVVVRKFKLTRRHRIAALGAGVVLMLFVWSQIAIASKRSTLDGKKQLLATLQPRATALAKTIQETQRADQWYRTRNVWLDVLSALKQNMSTSNLWIVTATFDDPGFIRIQGKARDDNHVTDFVTNLNKSKKFATVAIERIDVNKGEKPEYKKDFTVNAVLAGVDPKKKKN
jgi:Tfp pilus assembly protein PilN